VARLRYRPQTNATAAWFAKLNRQAKHYLSQYQAVIDQKSLKKVRNQGADEGHAMTNLPLAQNPKAELFRLADGFLGKYSRAFVTKLLKAFRDDVGSVRKVLELAKASTDAVAYVNKVIKNRKDLLNREALDQAQIDNWGPVRGQYPEIDYLHPKQPYYIYSNIDRKKLYLDCMRVEELVNSQKDRLGLSQRLEC
jgi:hypothetical protein